MITRLEEVVVSQRRFIGLAAHELRLPLTTVYGELSHALRRSRDAESYRLAVEEALDSTRRLKSLAEDLLTLSRVGPDRPGVKTAVSLADVVAAAARQLTERAHERRIELVIDADDAVVPGVAGDLERLVRNLLDNAVRHSPDGGRVSIRIERAPSHVLVAISDAGPGVPADERENIFEPFYQGRDHSDGTGAGLGLAIARQIARGHGGDVRAVPTVGGACFEVMLPVEQDLEATG
jgi:two-component system heavy metal sensor histidine kinase CusS